MFIIANAWPWCFSTGISISVPCSAMNMAYMNMKVSQIKTEYTRLNAAYCEMAKRIFSPKRKGPSKVNDDSDDDDLFFGDDYGGFGDGGVISDDDNTVVYYKNWSNTFPCHFLPVE